LVLATALDWRASADEVRHFFENFDGSECVKKLPSLKSTGKYGKVETTKYHEF